VVGFTDLTRVGDVEKVKALLVTNPELINSKDKSGETPLHWAALMDHKDVVLALLAYKADVNAKNNIGATPLHRAAGCVLRHLAAPQRKSPEGCRLRVKPVSRRTASLVRLIVRENSYPDWPPGSQLHPVDLATTGFFPAICQSI
jgi:hypothetical protein